MDSKVQQALDYCKQQNNARELAEQRYEEEEAKKRTQLLVAIDQEGVRIARKLETADWSKASLAKVRQPRKWWQLRDRWVFIAFRKIEGDYGSDLYPWLGSDGLIYATPGWVFNSVDDLERPDHPGCSNGRLRELLKRLQQLP